MNDRGQYGRRAACATRFRVGSARVHVLEWGLRYEQVNVDAVPGQGKGTRVKP